MGMITALIDRLKYDADFLEKHSGETEKFVNDYREAADTIQLLSKKLRASQMEQGWILVSEKLPEEFESVLVCYKSQGGMAYCISERLVNMDGSNRWSAMCGQEPIAWMRYLNYTR